MTASSESSAVPYPVPQPASRTRRPAAKRRANAYLAACSLQRSDSTWPGITRSPVNSDKLPLRRLEVVGRLKRRYGARTQRTAKNCDRSFGDSYRAATARELVPTGIFHQPARRLGV